MCSHLHADVRTVALGGREQGSGRSADQIASRSCSTRVKRGLVIGLLAVSLPTVLSCGRKQVQAAPPAPAPRVADQPKPPAQPAGPVSEPQTTVKLPPPQPIPPEAIPEVAGPLAEQPSDDIAPAGPHGPEPETAVPADEVSDAEPKDPATGDVPVPQLGQILTAVERREYNRLIDEHIAEAKSSLERVLAQSRPLSADENSAVRRIRAFMDQAAEARRQDLALAKNLAERARLLAEDLAKGLP